MIGEKQPKRWHGQNLDYVLQHCWIQLTNMNHNAYFTISLYWCNGCRSGATTTNRALTPAMHCSCNRFTIYNQDSNFDFLLYIIFIYNYFFIHVKFFILQVLLEPRVTRES